VAKLVKLLVTGAAGFIGFHAARRLLERGDELVGLDNLNACYDPGLKAARLEILRRRRWRATWDTGPVPIWKRV
jgi:nucleoside-diphosphate-sugar epimerase